MADSYDFDVKAHVEQSVENLNEVKDLMMSINNISQEGANNQGFLSASSLQQSINLMRELQSQASNLKSSLGEIYANTQDPTYLNQVNSINSSSNSFMNQGMNSYNDISGMNFGSSIGTRKNYSRDMAFSSVEDNSNLFDNSDMYDDQLFLREQRSNMNHFNTKQSRRVQNMQTTGSVTQDTFDSFNHDNASMDYDNLANTVSERINSAQSRIKDAETFRSSAINDTSLSNDDIAERTHSADKVITQNERLVEQLERFESEIKSSSDKMDTWNSSVDKIKDSDDGLKVTPGRGTIGGYLQQRSGAIAYHTVANAAGYVGSLNQAGLQLNSATDDTAINMSYATGASNDQAVRDNLFNINQQRSNGYGLEDSLRLEQLSMQRTGFNGGDQSTTNSMINEMEQGGNNTGIGRENYENLATAASNSGALNNTADVRSLDQSVTGMNVYARTAGMQQQNAQALTNVINQTGQDRVITSGDVERLSAVQGIMQRAGGRDLQGQQGSRAFSQLNGSFLNASEGNNERMVSLMVQSNPEKYGGLGGSVRAEEELSKGLSSNENIQLARRLNSQFGGSSDRGGGGARIIQNMFGVKNPNSADDISRILENGNLSESEQQKAISRIQNDGKNRQNRNQNTYNGSSTSQRNQRSSEKERQSSQMNSANEQTIGRISTTVGQLPTLLTTIIGITGSILAAMAVQGGASVLAGKGRDILSRRAGGGKSGGTGEGGSIRPKGSPEGEGSGGGKRGIFGRMKDRVSRTKTGRRVSTLLSSARESKIGGKASSLFEHAKGLGGKVLGHAGPLADIAMAGTSIFGGVHGKHAGSQLFKNAGDFVGGSAGWSGGMAGGAALGSFAGPVGTFVGGAVGAIGGSILGSKVGRGATSWIAGKTNKFLDHHANIKGAVKNTEGAIGKAGSWAGSKLKSGLGYVGKAAAGLGGWLGLTGGGKAESSLEESAVKSSRLKRLGLLGGVGVAAAGGSALLAKHNADKQGKTASGSMAYQNSEQSTDNIRKQTENISAENRTLQTAKQLLNQAKQQNGIIGKSSSGGSGGTPDYNKKGKAAAANASTMQSVKKYLNQHPTIKSLGTAAVGVSTGNVGAALNGFLGVGKGAINKAKSIGGNLLKGLGLSHHKYGGITSQQQVSYLSENDSEEAIVPLDPARVNEPRSKALASAVAGAYNLHKPSNEKSGSKNNVNNSYEINVKVNGDVKNPQETGQRIAQSIEENMKQKNSDAIYNNSSAFTVVNGNS